MKNYLKVAVYPGLTNRILVVLARILTGGVFIFSGFAKAIDPWGTLYKFREYLEVMGMPLPDSVVLVFGISLSVIEFSLGVFLLLGCFRKWSPIVSLVIMIAMLLLTGWVALFNPVSDCGCFGDLLVVSNKVTFFKNILLTALIFFLVRYNKNVAPSITPYLQWLAMFGAAAFVASLALYGYEVQPLIDFRPFPVGSPLLNENNDSDPAGNMIFIYVRGEERISVKSTDLQPSEKDGWIFEGREITSAPISTPATGKGNSEFRIFSCDDEEEDVSSSIINQDTEALLILLPEHCSVSKADIWRIEAISDQAKLENIEVAVVLGTTDSEIVEEWQSNLANSVDIYSADDVEIKMLARGNPAIVMVDKGIVKWKTTLTALPPQYYDRLVEAGASYPTDSRLKLYSRNDSKLLLSMCGILSVWLLLLILMSKITTIHGGMAHHEVSSSHDKVAQ